jgi:hypothetical protein
MSLLRKDLMLYIAVRELFDDTLGKQLTITEAHAKFEIAMVITFPGARKEIRERIEQIKQELIEKENAIHN